MWSRKALFIHLSSSLSECQSSCKTSLWSSCRRVEKRSAARFLQLPISPPGHCPPGWGIKASLVFASLCASACHLRRWSSLIGNLEVVSHRCGSLYQCLTPSISSLFWKNAFCSAVWFLYLFEHLSHCSLMLDCPSPKLSPFHLQKESESC